LTLESPEAKNDGPLILTQDPYSRCQPDYRYGRQPYQDADDDPHCPTYILLGRSRSGA
jgi:hypothetical protein